MTDSPTPPTDPVALAEEVLDLHWAKRMPEHHARECEQCGADWPCLPARLARAVKEQAATISRMAESFNTVSEVHDLIRAKLAEVTEQRDRQKETLASIYDSLAAAGFGSVRSEGGRNVPLYETLGEAVDAMATNLAAAEEENGRLQEEYEGSPVRAELEDQLNKCKEAIGDEWPENMRLWEAIQGLQGDAKTLRAFCKHQGRTPMMMLSRAQHAESKLAAAEADTKRLKAQVENLCATIKCVEWSTGYDQCPQCGGANPTKMEDYRAACSGPFIENDFGHGEYCSIGTAIAAIDAAEEGSNDD